MGGGGYVAGPVGLAAVRARVPLVLTEADSHLGLDQPPARAPRAAGLPGLPDRGPRRGEVPRHRAARSRRRRPTATPPAPASASTSATAACSSSAARWARARSTAPRSRASPTRPTACCTPPAPATSPIARSAPRDGLRPARVHRRLRRGAAGRRRLRRPLGRLDRRGRRPRPAGDPRALSARRGRPPGRQRALDGRRRRGRGRARRRPHARPGCGPRSTRCWAIPRAWPRWRSRRAALARPDAAARIASEVLSAAS